MTNDLKGSLGEYKIIETDDQSKTLWSSFFDETFHNKSGALEETFYTYLNPTLCERAFYDFNGPFSILEVGFGMGLGLYALENFILTKEKEYKIENSQVNIYFTSFEIDALLIKWLINEEKNNPYKLQILPNLSEWTLHSDKSNEYYQVSKTILINQTSFRFHGTLLVGDARKVLSPMVQILNIPKFKVIFQDAFSPKKNPDLWTVEWFETLKSLSHEEVILSTYSSSTSIRKNLLENEWYVYSQKAYGHKKAMTKATLSNKFFGEMDPVLLKKMADAPSLLIFDRDIKVFLTKRNLELK